MGVNRAEMTDATPEGITSRVFTMTTERGKKFLSRITGPQRRHAGCRKVIVAMHAEALEGLGRLYRLRFYARKRRFHYDFRLPRPHHDPYHS